MAEAVETCPECGHDLTEEQEPEEFVPQKVGECVDCGIDIYQREWHVEDTRDQRRLPDYSMMSVWLGSPDPGTRWCGPCSERAIEEFPDDKPIAGVDADA